jgi:Flp pilus assembly pilin Flp
MAPIGARGPYGWIATTRSVVDISPVARSTRCTAARATRGQVVRHDKRSDKRRDRTMLHLYLKTRELLRRDEEGALSAEYVAVLVIVAAIVAVIIALNLPETVDGAGKEAVDGMFG